MTFNAHASRAEEKKQPQRKTDGDPRGFRPPRQRKRVSRGSEEKKEYDEGMRAPNARAGEVAVNEKYEKGEGERDRERWKRKRLLV